MKKFTRSLEEIAKYLSACGWRWNPDSRAWVKGAAPIFVSGFTEEAVEAIAEQHHWALPYFFKAAEGTPVNLNVTIEEDADGKGATAHIRWES